jgi:tetratricopeptide (TPR) repeat protein
MKDSILSENLFSKDVKNLIAEYKNDIIKKSIHSFLDSNYRETEMILLTEYPENSFNKDTLVQYLIGHVKLKLQEYESSLNYFCRALKTKDPQQVSLVYVSKGLVCLYQHNYDEAILNFKEACINSPDDFNFHNQLALCYIIIYNLQQERTENIVNLSELTNNNNNSLIESKSKSITSSNIDSNDEEKEKEQKKDIDKKKFGKMKNNLDKIKNKIMEQFKEAININQNSYIALINLGSFYANRGHIELAEECFKKAENINKQDDQKDYKLYINLGYMAFYEKDYPLSMGYFEMAIKLYENHINIKILYIYMICLCKNNEWKKLERISKRLLKIDRTNKKALVYLIISLENNKKYNDLLILLNKIKAKLKVIKENDIEDDPEESEKSLDIMFDTPLSKYKQIKKIIRDKIKVVNEKLKIQRQLVSPESNEIDLAKLNKDTLKSFGFQNQDIERILILYKENPYNLEALFNLGYIFYKEEDFEKSEQYLKKIIEIDPNYKKIIVYECLGDIYLNEHNEPKKALEYYIESEAGEGNELLFVKMGICYEMLDDNESALKYYQKAHEKNEEFVNPMFHIGCIYEKMKNPKAIKWLETAYDREKENVDYLQKYGDILVESDDEKLLCKGISILEKGIEFFTGNIEIISSLAKGYEKQGKLKEAIQILEKAKNTEEFSNNKSKVFQLANYYEKAKKLTKAIEFYKKVIALDNKNVEALSHIAYLYRTLKENIKAFKCFKQILLIDPNNFYAFYGLARLYQSLDNQDNEAIECFKNCLKIEPRSIKANLQLGIVYLKIKNLEESLKCLQIVIESEPENILGLVALGNVYLEMSNYEEAEKTLEIALKLDKKNIPANTAMGDVLFGLGKIPEAIQKYTYINTLNDRIPEVHLNLGHCYFTTEKFDASINQYLQAIRLVKNTRHDYFYFLGNALIASMRTKDGIIAYQAAIKLKKNKLNYYYAIAKACYVEKLYSKGIKYLERLIEIEKKKKNVENDKDYTENDILLLLYKLNSSLPQAEFNYDKCCNIIKTLIRNEPKNVQYLEILANLQDKNGYTFDAIKTFKQVLRLEPDNYDIKNKISQLYTNTSKRKLVFERSNSSSSSSEKVDDEKEN